MKKAASITFAFLFLAGLIPFVSSLENGQVGVLYVGDPFRSPAFAYMKSDPLFSITFVVASVRNFGGFEADEVHRAVRLYMPRSSRDLIAGFDGIILAEAN